MNDKYEFYKYLSLCLSKSLTTRARIYENEECVYYSSVYDLEVDPIEPYKDKIFKLECEAGIITTPLLQYYSFVTLEPGVRMIFGPTRTLVDKGKEVDDLLRQLNVTKKDEKKYLDVLYALPAIHVNRLRWFFSIYTDGAARKTFFGRGCVGRAGN